MSRVTSTNRKVEQNKTAARGERPSIARPNASKVTVLGDNATPDDVGVIAEILRSIAVQQAEPDAFADQYSPSNLSKRQPIQPPYNLNTLVRMPEDNGMLKQCIDAMVTNVYGHGWRLEYVGKDGQAETPEALKEKEVAEGFIQSPNGETGWQDMLEALGSDREYIGNGYLELGRSEKGEAVILSHLVGTSVRLTPRDEEETPVEHLVPRGGQLVKVKSRKRFRRFIQQIGNRKIYFKEVGDPRKIDPKTGEVDDDLSFEDSATELYHFHAYNPRSPYGVPRWIGQLTEIVGSRQAALTNLDYFSENAIPAMVISVAGGMLTDESIRDLEEIFQRARGRKAQNRVLILEAQGDPASAADNGQIPAPKIDMKPMAENRQSEGHFLEYKRDCNASIRSSFRLPPIFVGLAEDYTQATANTSFEVGESQVFAPERNKFEEFMNRIILPSMGVTKWQYRSLPAKITNPEDVITALETFDKIGGMTPNASIDLANEYFGLKLARINEEWGNWPFQIVKALATAGRLKGIEAIQEKALEIEGAATGVELPDSGDTEAEQLDEETKKLPPKKTGKTVKEKAESIKELARNLHEITAG